MSVPTSGDARPRTPRKRTRRAAVAPSNVLILVVPSLVLHASLQPAFHAHFASYGTLHAWTPLTGLGRVVCVYGDEREAQAAKDEMDGFFWADESDAQARGFDPGQAYEPLRAYYGPPFPPSRFQHLPTHAGGPLASSSSGTASAEQDHLSVPDSGRNFLISPPGSPPVGWEQIEEESPNTRTWHEGDEPPTPRTRQVELDELSKAASPDAAWADELARALRFLSVDALVNDEDEEDEAEPFAEGDSRMRDDGEEEHLGPSTHMVLAPAPLPPFHASSHASAPPASSSAIRPAVTVSAPVPPPASAWDRPPTPPSTTATPPPGASKITSVKATVEAMQPMRDDDVVTAGAEDARRSGPRFVPTARPPMA